MSILYNFFIINGYVFEILTAVGFFYWRTDRRPRFLLCVAGTVAVPLAVSMLWALMSFDNVRVKSIRGILFSALYIVGVKACFAVSVNHAIFYVTAVRTAQHFSFQTARILLALGTMILNLPEEVTVFVHPVLSIAFLFLCYWMFDRELKKEGTGHLTGPPTILLLLTGIQLYTNISQNLFNGYSVGSDFAIYTIYSISDMVYCLFLLTLRCEIARKESEQQNNEMLKHVLYQQKQQVKISGEIMGLISIRYHDIKNQIVILGSHVPQEEISKLKRIIDIHDMTSKAGNETLDALMVEKLTVHESKSIWFDCMVGGQSLDFMKQSDIYSLFGSAAGNAVEVMDRIASPEKRCISAKIRIERGMLMIHPENFYEGRLTLTNRLPQTTKQDKRYHGFDTRSIQMIAERYHGYLSAKAEQEIFTLGIPLSMMEWCVSYADKIIVQEGSLMEKKENCCGGVTKCQLRESSYDRNAEG